MSDSRIHIVREEAEGYLRPLSGLRGLRRWGLYGYDGRLRCELFGTAGQVRREAKRVIECNKNCFPIQPKEES